MRWRPCVAMLVVACALACGGRAKRVTSGSHESSSGDAGESTATGGSAGVGGAAGASGSAGAAGAACRPAFEALDPTNARCGDEACESLPVANPRLENYVSHCCTTDVRCGAGSQRIYGSGCFERDRVGAPSDACPAQWVLVTYDAVSDVPVGDYFPGCCLPEGLCGLDTRGSLGAGCVERSVLRSALHTTCVAENLRLELEPIPCTP